MEAKKNFVKSPVGTVAIISFVGVLVAILSSTINCFFLEETNEVLDSIGIIGFLVFILPFFLCQFLIPSKLLDRFGIQTDFTPWVKVVLYIILFPVVNGIMISTVDAIFHFLPNFHEAMAQGEDLVVVQAIREQWVIQVRIIMVSVYVFMIGAGLLFRKIFGNKFKAVA